MYVRMWSVVCVVVSGIYRRAPSPIPQPTTPIPPLPGSPQILPIPLSLLTLVIGASSLVGTPNQLGGVACWLLLQISRQLVSFLSLFSGAGRWGRLGAHTVPLLSPLSSLSFSVHGGPAIPGAHVRLYVLCICVSERVFVNWLVGWLVG